MRKVVLLLISFLISISCTSTKYSFDPYERHLKNVNQIDQPTSKLDLTISTEKSGQLLSIEFKNRSLESIYIPSDFDVISNLWPNGRKYTRAGGLIILSITPIPKWSEIIIEDIAISPPQTFERIKPNSSISYSFGLEDYLSDFVQAHDKNIDLSDTLSIEAEYQNFWDHYDEDKRTWKGQIKSKEIILTRN